MLYHTYIYEKMTHALAGQVISSEVLMASEPGCPIEFHRIKINRCDEMYDKKCRGEKYMPFHRAIYDSKTGQSPNNPREQVCATRQGPNTEFLENIVEIVTSSTNIPPGAAPLAQMFQTAWMNHQKFECATAQHRIRASYDKEGRQGG